MLPNNFFAAKLLVIIDSCLPQSFTSMLVSLFEPTASTNTHGMSYPKKFRNARALHTHKHNVNKSVKNGRLNEKKNSNKSTEYFKESEFGKKKWSSVWVASNIKTREW